jgi:hypothetical protein
MANQLTVNVNVKCPLCKKEYTVKNVPVKGFMEWKEGGKHIQDALPTLSADDREALITGVCKTCWDNMFADHG